MNTRIRSEVLADAPAIEALTVEAFRGATHSSQTEHLIVAGLRQAGVLSISLVAELDGAIVGHVAISPVEISGEIPGWYGLGPISVAPARQGQGIGSRLAERALAQLRELGAAGCVVLGEPGYYRRFGFRPEPALVLPDVPPAYFQAVAFRGSVPAGTVSYHEAFDARP